MATSKFPTLRDVTQPQVSRVQDGIAGVLNPVAKALQNTPIMGASPPSWIRPDLLNGWVNFGGAFALVAYHRDALGYVHTKGVAQNSTGAGLILPLFTFPLGYRPLENQAFAAVGPGATAQFYTVTFAGMVTPQVAVAAGGVTYFSLPPFLAEN